MRFLFPLLKSHTPKFVYYEKDSNSRHLTALDDESFSEKKRTKKHQTKKRKSSPQIYSQLKRTKKEREIRERKRKI